MTHATAQGLMMVISAPSGTGKTTLCRKLLDECPDLHFSVSCTTRPAREGEKEGRDYHFITPEEFKERVARDEFIEWEELFGNCYGTAKRTIEEMLMKGRDVVLDIDTRGARRVKTLYPDAVFIFIMPPSVEILKERLKNRRSETDDIIEVRFDRAMEEIRANEWYDYVVFNDIVPDSVAILRSIYVAEKNRRPRLQNRIDDFYRKTGGT
ncbi:MAG: guanylate kinase [Syntrophaceae bacterium]|nr:guanylate kinase [Syntrophaceae bacterium]